MGEVSSTLRSICPRPAPAPAPALAPAPAPAPSSCEGGPGLILSGAGAAGFARHATLRGRGRAT